MLCFSKKNNPQIYPEIQESYNYNNLLNELIKHKQLQESIKKLYIIYVNQQRYIMNLIKTDEKYPFSYFQYEKNELIKKEFDMCIKKLEKNGDELYSNFYKNKMDVFYLEYENFLKGLYNEKRLIIENIYLKKKEIQKLFSLKSPKVSFLKLFKYIY
jgi:hypothetical protein